MTDGGVYNNVGLSPLHPGRFRASTGHVYDVDYLIVADAGRGRTARTAARFWLRRMKQSFEIVHTDAQDAARARLHLGVPDRRCRASIRPDFAGR